jgi:ActR/RegA family two-component response regulator
LHSCEEVRELQPLFSDAVQTPDVGTDRRRAVVCEDDATTSRVLGAILRRCGFEVVSTVDTFGAALINVALTQPDVVVVELATAGDLGVTVVDTLKEALPDCAVVVLSPFEALHDLVRKAGAYDVVSNAWRDVRDLEGCLVRLSQDLRRSDPGPVTQVAGQAAALD